MTPAPNNVFRGERSLHDFYDPEQNPPTPLVELPESLNPFLRSHNVHVYVKLHSALPAGNVKSLPALNMLQQGGIDAGFALEGQSAAQISRRKEGSEKVSRIVEYSSGSTVISLSILARIMGVHDVSAYLSNKTSDAKLKLMRFFGLKLHLFGGPSQPEPLDPRGGIYKALLRGKEEGSFNPDQYANPANYESHMRWTGPQLAKQLPEMDIFVAGMGTAGTMTGTGLALKKLLPTVKRIGVTTAPGDRVPGPRSEALLAPVEFPWRDAIDAMEWVGSADSYARSIELCRTGLMCGPSSGFNLQGLFQHLRRHIEVHGDLDALRKQPGAPIHAAFIACDGPYQYIDEYFSKLPTEAFHPIQNDVLIGVDLYRYDDAWELQPYKAFELAYTYKLEQCEASSNEEHSRSTSTSGSPSAEELADRLADLRRPSATPSDMSVESSTSSLFSSSSASDAGSRASKSSSATSTAGTSPERSSIATLRKGVKLLDLRGCNVKSCRFFQATSVELHHVSETSTDPFSDPHLLAEQWKELDSLFEPNNPRGLEILSSVDSQDQPAAQILVVCQDGGASRIATSILRHRGFQASFVAGGASRWTERGWPVQL
ncbi:Cystathionine beta-synthase and related enzymes [Ceraceosorus bombacis]|uniref:Cystathionine beta-synthase and related enzymes n=1 Tax=Ceraceosorus bombacis TaxID=401625 RepID=A0A0P1BGI9_9BASI|nr:Cystathionine beta-synthase and related enzymes [Ceraceosorus bombacis]